MKVAILWASGKPCCHNRLQCLLLPSAQRTLQYPLSPLGLCLKLRGSSNHRSSSSSTTQFVCHYSSSCFCGILSFLIGISRRTTIVMPCVEDIWWIFHDRLTIALYEGHSCLGPGQFDRCVPWNIMINRTSVSPTLSVAITSNSTWLCSGISPYLCLPLLVFSVHFSIDALRWGITVNTMLKCKNQMLGVGGLPHQPSHTHEYVSTAVFVRALVIVIPFHILKSV